MDSVQIQITYKRLLKGQKRKQIYLTFDDTTIEEVMRHIISMTNFSRIKYFHIKEVSKKCQK